MKIKMNTSMTTLDQVDNVKAAMKEFKSRFTDGDLKMAIIDHLTETESWEAANALYGNVLRCDVEAFPHGFTMWMGADFAVEMVIESVIRIARVCFYCDENLKIDAGRDLITVRIFEEETSKAIYA